MTEGGNGRLEKISSRLRGAFDSLRVKRNESYNINSLWASRKNGSERLFDTGIKTPHGLDIKIGLREASGELGKKAFVLGYFVNENEQTKPIGFFVAEKSYSGSSLLSNAMNRKNIIELKDDKIFSGIYEMAAGSDTIFIKDDYRNLGLGRNFVEVMLDVCDKTNSTELILNNVSGYVHRLIDSMTGAGRANSRWLESSGTLFIKRGQNSSR